MCNNFNPFFNKTMDLEIQKTYLNFKTEEEYIELFKKYNVAFTKNLIKRMKFDDELTQLVKDMEKVNKNRVPYSDKNEECNKEFKKIHDIYTEKLIIKKKLMREMKIITNIIKEMGEKSKKSEII